MLRFLPALVVLAAACSLDNPGIDPPEGDLNFPIAVQMSPDGQFLYVANSNFDLRFNGGSVQTYLLDEVANRTPAGSRDVVIDTADSAVRRSEVLIGAHASGMALSPAGDRLYLSVRSDSNLTFVDVDSAGNLSCSTDLNARRCADEFRRGDVAVSSERNEAVPVDPTGVVVGDLSTFDPALSGDFVLMSHRAGQVSFFIDRTEGLSDAPTLVNVLTGLPDELINIRFDPSSRFAWAPSARESRMTLVGLAIDTAAADPRRSFAFNGGTPAVAGVNDGSDTRDVLFDAATRRAYVLSRQPEALLLVDLDRSDPGSLFVQRSVPIGDGPSRLAQGTFQIDGADRRLVFASCFDSRDVWIVDPNLGEVVSVIRGMSGPFELAVDEDRARIYITDFRSSVIRIADLSPMLTCLGGDYSAGTCEPPILGTLGDPRPVGELL